MYVPIVFLLKDLSPQLRIRISRSEVAAMEAEGRAPSAAELPAGTMDAFGRLLGHFEVWLLVFGGRRKSHPLLYNSTVRPADVYAGVPLQSRGRGAHELLLLAGESGGAGVAPESFPTACKYANRSRSSADASGAR